MTLRKAFTLFTLVYFEKDKIIASDSSTHLTLKK